MARSRRDTFAALRERIDALEAELDAEEREEAEAATAQERRESAEDVKALRAELAELRAELKAAREGQGDDDQGDDQGDDDQGDDDQGDDDQSNRATRPGRKKGLLYDWDVDEEGQVVDLPIATIYSGEDEEDEVELPEAASS